MPATADDSAPAPTVLQGVVFMACSSLVDPAGAGLLGQECSSRPPDTPRADPPRAARPATWLPAADDGRPHPRLGSPYLKCGSGRCSNHFRTRGGIAWATEAAQVTRGLENLWRR
ncbi:hypothetical protein GCM10023168_02980 [Fodinibacter luteus]|uniref:Uncharacterized protein n=1 Tax=Fodinibacter luteus TaxID=552064 RepID=A0ABP8JXQ5_9MICO